MCILYPVFHNERRAVANKLYHCLVCTSLDGIALSSRYLSHSKRKLEACERLLRFEKDVLTDLRRIFSEISSETAFLRHRMCLYRRSASTVACVRQLDRILPISRSSRGLCTVHRAAELFEPQGIIRLSD